MPTYATPGPIKAKVQVAGARVHLRASNRTDTVVLVEPVNPASAKDVRVAGKTRAGFSAGALTVRTTDSGERNGSVAITIDLPAGSGLVVDQAYSSVQVDGALGECEVNMGSGRIRLDRIDGLRANLAAGEFAVNHVAGAAEIQGGSAAVRIGEVTGAVKLVGSAGHVWIGDAATDVDLSNSTGGFDIERAGGNVTALAGGSSVIRVGRMTRGHANLMNASGNIEVGIGEGSTVRVAADSKYGTVRNSVPSQDSDTAASVTVEARTRRGDIIIHRS